MEEEEEKWLTQRSIQAGIETMRERERERCARKVLVKVITVWSCVFVFWEGGREEEESGLNWNGHYGNQRKRSDVYPFSPGKVRTLLEALSLTLCPYVA